MDFDHEVRWHVYDATMRRGVPPPVADLAAGLHVPVEDVAAALERLAQARMLVLQPETHEILMAGPYSAVPTPFRVQTSGPSAFGNCIWDALGIVAMLDERNARVDTSCADCGTAAQLHIVEGEIRASGFMHFLLPPRIWWQDIVFT